MCGPDGGAGIEGVRSLRGGLEEIVEGTRDRSGAMLQPRQMARHIGADAQTLTRGRAMADGSVHLLAAEHEFNGPIHQARGHNAEDLRSRDQALAAKAAAEERAANMDVLGWNTKQSGNARLCQSKTLAWRVDGELIAIP